MHELRDYQRAAIDAIYAYWENGGGNPLVELATGTGKSLIAATICKELLEQWPDLRIGIVAHVKELIAQNCQEMIRMWPAAPVGIYSAGIGRRDHNAKILFCGIQSVYNKMDQLGGFDVLVIDEAHMIPRKSQTMYGRFLEACRKRVPDMRIIGLTATPYRLDSGRLVGSKDSLFDKIVYSYGVGDGVRDGYLSQLVSKATLAEINVNKVAVRGGEFVPLELQAAACDDAIVSAATAELVRMGQNRRAWLVFCTGVSHAWDVAKQIRVHGVGGVEVISGETQPGERDRLIKAFRAGQLRCLVNVNVLTTGFNVPQVDLVGLMRPTLSTGLYVQMLGRGTRLADSKQDCLVLDWGGNVRRHGPVDDVYVKDKSRKSESGRVKVDSVRAKECPKCHSLAGLASIVCRDCGYEWPRNASPKHDAQADGSRSVMGTAPPKWLQVNEVEFERHRPKESGKPPTLRVEYYCGLAVHKEWICFEHQGFPRRKAEEWWRRMGGGYPVPDTIDSALSRIDELDWPREICVRPDGKWFRIVSRKMPSREAA